MKRNDVLPLHCRQCVFAISLLITSYYILGWAGLGHAEGSRTLYPSGALGYRADLDLQPGAAGAENRYVGKVRRSCFLYVYAQGGEYIVLGSRNRSSGGDINVYNPQNFGVPGDEIYTAVSQGTPNYTCSGGSSEVGPHYFGGTRGTIATRDQELAGPRSADNSAGGTNTFTPCAYRVPSTGIYGVLFEAATTGLGNPDGSIATPAVETLGVSAWDVTVRANATSTTDINGRLFTYAFIAYAGDNQHPVYYSLWYVSRDGYRYQQYLNGLDGAGYALYANAIGFLDNGQPLYKDLRGNEAMVDSLPLGVTTQTADYPIFFNDASPSGANATEVNRVLTALNIPLAPTAATLSNVQFAGSAYGSTSYLGTGGTFTFDTTNTITYQIVISHDGIGFDPSDVNNATLTGLAPSGTNTVVWNGMNNSNVNFPAGGPYSYRVFGRNGEIHFPIIDAENNYYGGPRITRLNGIGAPDATVYYDDRGYILSTGGSVGTLNGTLCPTATPPQPVPAFNLAGVDSSTAYRTWGVNAGTNNTNYDCTSTNAWGDTKAINIWTYYSTAPVTQTLAIISSNVDVATTLTGPDTATTGGTITGTYTFGNNGTTTAHNVTYSMSLSPGLGTVTFGNRPTGTTLTYNNVTGVVTVSGTPLPTTLTAGQKVLGATPTAPMTYSYTAPASGPVTVHTTIATTDTDGVPSNNSATLNTYVGTVDVQTTITVTSQIEPYGTVSGNVQFTNNGTLAAAGMTYTATIGNSSFYPTMLTFTSVPTGVTPSYNNTTGVISFAGLPSTLGSSQTFTVGFSYAAPSSGSIPASSSITTTSTDANPANNTSSATTFIGPDLTVAKSHTGNFYQGQNGAQYTITVNNIGGLPTSGTITVTDTLPTGLTYVSSAGTGWSCGAAGQVVTCTSSAAIAEGGAGNAITLTVNVGTGAGSPLVNTVSVSGGGETRTSNNSAADSTIVATGPDLTVTKSHTGDFYRTQIGAQYTITVNNVGGLPTSGTITVTDTLPAGLTYVSGTGTGWSCSAVGQVVTCTSSTAIAAGGAGNPITLTVNVAAGAGSPLINTVEVDGGGETNTSNNTNTDSTTVLGSDSDLTVTKTHTGNFTQGQTGAQYTITPRNIGNARTSGTITVIDTLPGGLTYVSATGTNWTCSAAGQVVTCATGSRINANTNGNVITLIVNVSPNADTPLVNNVSIGGGGETNTSNNTDTDSTIVLQLPDLTITKTHTGNFTQGQNGVQYTITPSNIGGANTTGTITVTDTLPTGLTYVSGTGTSWSCGAVGQTVTCTSNTVIPAGGNGNSITLTVNVSGTAGSPLVNNVSISGGGETNTGNNTDTDSTVILTRQDLTVTKSHTGNFYRNQTNALYTITVSNIGGASTDATITVTDTLPTGLTYSSSTTGTGWACSAAGQVVTCTSSAAIAGGGSGNPISLYVNVASNAGASLTNNVSVSGGGETNASNNTDTDATTISTTAPDLTVSKSHTGNFTQGQNGAQYTITPSNIGNANTIGTITITDTLPTGLTYASRTGTGWTCNAAGQVVTCTSTTVITAGNNGNTLTLTVNVSANAGSPLVNNVSISGGGESNTNNNTATDSTTVISGPDVIVSKSHTGSFYQGQTGAQYTITVSNNGGVATTGTITVADTLPAGLTYGSGTGTGWSCSAVGQVVTCTSSTVIAAGGSGNPITLTVNVAMNAGSPLVNNVSVSGGGQTNTTNDTATDSTTVGTGPDLTVTKSHDNAFYLGQNGAQYTITVSNIGNATTTGTITVSDTLPTGLSYVSATGTGWSCGAASEVVTCTSSTGIAGGSSSNPITLTVNVSMSAPYSLTNNAIVSLAGQTESDTNNNIGTDITTVMPTLVTLISFKARNEDGQVVIEWETASEQNTLGFYLARFDPANETYRSITEGLLPSLITNTKGGTYSLIDRGALPGETLRYMLVEVERNGKKILYGPFSVSTETGSVADSQSIRMYSAPSSSRVGKSAISDYSRKTRQQRLSKRPLVQMRSISRMMAAPLQQAQRSSGKGSRIRIPISENGLYYMDAKDISEITGINYESIKQRIGARNLSMSTQGRPVAYLPASGNEGLFFYGTGANSVYTRNNIYWIDTGKGRLMNNEIVHIPSSPAQGDAFSDSLHIEQDVFPNMSQTTNPAEDYWDWDIIYLSPGYSDGPKSYTFMLHGKADSQKAAILQVHLVGGSDSGISDDHHVVIKLNGQQIGKEEGELWGGLKPYTFEAAFDQSLLKEGENTIEVEGLLDEGIPFSMFLINSFDLTYERLYKADGNKLFFHGDGNESVRVQGFTTPDILLLNVTNPETPGINIWAVTDSSNGDYGISLKPVSPDARYLAIAGDAIVKVLNAQGVNESSLRLPGNRADYLIITTGELASAIKPLSDYRASQGMQTKTVTVDDIMNEFNFGLSSPEAIRRFLTYANKFWSKPPKYVLLAGGGTWDYRDNEGQGGNLIPPAMVSTSYGLFTSDNYLADINGDHVPEMAIGRLPVLTPEEMKNVIEKIKAFEASSTRRIILVADNADEGGDFPSDSEDIAKLVPSGYTTEKVYLGEYASTELARTALHDYLNSGSEFFNYIGHASFDMFAAEGIFTSGDIDPLVNGVGLPIVTAMTCTAGEFAMPGYPTISQLMVLQYGRGAVAFWSATGLSDNEKAKILNWEFYNAVFNSDKKVLGDAVLQALGKFKINGSTPSMMDIYAILGDPALRLR